MKKTFKLQGLDCANCAMKIEKVIQNIPGVEEASVNFMTTRLNVRGERENMAIIVDKIKDTIHELEPDVEMIKA